ncbi:MAG: NTP transferase domain-containing protein [Acidobacteriota bacterium]
MVAADGRDPTAGSGGAGSGHKVAGLILAAGASRRMGFPKPLLPLAGRTYLEHILDTLATSPVDPTLVILGHRAEEIRAAVSWEFGRPLIHRGWRQGMLSSLQAGLRALETCEAGPRRDHVEAVLVALVDVPLFSLASVLALLMAFERTSAPILVPVHEGRRGHPVLFARRVWSDLHDAPAEAGAIAVVRRHAASVIEVQVEDEGILWEADTPEQHRRLRQRRCR